MWEPSPHISEGVLPPPSPLERSECQIRCLFSLYQSGRHQRKGRTLGQAEHRGRTVGKLELTSGKCPRRRKVGIRVFGIETVESRSERALEMK